MDILVPAALEGVITAEERREGQGAHHRRGRQRADDAGRGRRSFATTGIVVIPDILANAGGVTVSYFEWVQDLYSFFWDAEMVRTHLQKTIRRAYEDVESAARKHDTDLRTGALVVAIGRVAEATRVRGIFP